MRALLVTALVLLVTALTLWLLWGPGGRPTRDAARSSTSPDGALGSIAGPAEPGDATQSGEAGRAVVEAQQSGPQLIGRTLAPGRRPIAAGLWVVAGDGPQPVIEHGSETGARSDAATGRFSIPLEASGGATGRLVAESLDGRFRGVAPWSRAEVDPSSGDLVVGDLTLELEPRIVLEVFASEPLRAALRDVPAASVVAEASPLQPVGGAGLLVAGRPAVLHEFRLHDPGPQRVVTRIPARSIDRQRRVQLLWRFRQRPGADASPLLAEELDALQPGLQSRLELGTEHLLHGRVASGAEGVPALAMTALIKASSLFAGQFETGGDGRFAVLVPRASSGTLWSNVLGQSESVGWRAGEPADLEVGLERFVRIRVVRSPQHPGADLEPVTRCRLRSANRRVPLRPDAVAEAPAESPTGTYLYPRTALQLGERVFVQLPDRAEAMHEVLGDFAGGDAAYTLDVESLQLAAAALQVEVPGSFARSGPGALMVQLEGRSLNGRDQRVRYMFWPSGEGQRLEGLFAGAYRYTVQKGYDVLLEGEIELSDAETAVLTIGF